MRVICILGSWVKKVEKPVTKSYFFGLKKVTTQESKMEDTNGPKYGDILKVIETGNKPHLINGQMILCYKFEWGNEWFEASAFRPISEDEEQQASEQIKELLEETLK